jgi:hypothetical protein
MMMHRLGHVTRGGLVLLSLAFGVAAAAPAFADDCNQEIARLSKKRQDVIDDLNRLAKASPHGQLEPAASCPKLRGLVEAEKNLVGYLTKNKDWCMVPDDAIGNLTKSSERSKVIAAKACNIALQMKKQGEQQAAGSALGQPAQKLPSGPL